LLARHIAHLFIRDPISLFSEKINQNDEEDTDHFEVVFKYSLGLCCEIKQMIKINLKAAHLQIHANFYENFENVFKSKIL
jgi:hypothetical protein